MGREAGNKETNSKKGTRFRVLGASFVKIILFFNFLLNIVEEIRKIREQPKVVFFLSGMFLF